jgi:hypothetical protein
MALAAVQKCIFKVADNDGTIGSLALDVTTSGSDDPLDNFTAFYALFNAVSECKIVGQIGQTADNAVVGASATNPYDIRDKLEVGYVGSQNDHHKLMVGDLDPAILGTDKEHVDPTNADWLDLVTAIEANVVDKLGNAVTVTYGKRVRSVNLTRKVNPESA